MPNISKTTAAILGEAHAREQDAIGESSVAELERKLRRLRQEIFSYEGTPEVEAKQNELSAVKAQLMKLRQSSGDGDRGPYSGLTRGELSRSRTSETDWY
jgi:ribosomal protein L29